MTYQAYTALPDGARVTYTQAKGLACEVTVAKSRNRDSKGRVLVYLGRMRTWVRPATLSTNEGGPNDGKTF